MLFAIGDKVRVVKKVEDYQHWYSHMDKFVNDGKTYSVIEVDREDNDFLIRNGNDSFWFHSDALEKVDAPIEAGSLLGKIAVTGYHWNGNTYSTKTSLTRSIVKAAYGRFTNSNGDSVFIQQLIDELKEIKEVCQKLN